MAYVITLAPLILSIIALTMTVRNTLLIKKYKNIIKIKDESIRLQDEIINSLKKSLLN